MRLPVFPVLGAFLFVAVFGPFVLLFAGPALTGDPDAARVGLYLLLNVNPVAIPAILCLLGVAWAGRLWTLHRASPVPGVASPPPASIQTLHPAVVASVRPKRNDRGIVIDVVAVPADARPIAGGGHRRLTSATLRPAIALRAVKGLPLR